MSTTNDAVEEKRLRQKKIRGNTLTILNLLVNRKAKGYSINIYSTNPATRNAIFVPVNIAIFLEGCKFPC